MTPTSAESAHRWYRRWTRLARVWGILVTALVLYAILWIGDPDRARTALEASGRVLLQMGIPLCVVFVAMVLLNLFVGVARVSHVAGRDAGIRGIVFSTVAGILSTGPIYSWYPLLKSLREKGASDFHLANFLSNRAVKPFLLPIMVFYFGWVFTLVLTVLTVLGALVVASIVGVSAGRPPRQWPLATRQSGAS